MTISKKKSEKKLTVEQRLQEANIKDAERSTEIKLLEEIRDEIKALRKDTDKRYKEGLDFNKVKIDELDKYKKWATDLLQSKANSMNLGHALMPGISIDDLKKNTAKVIKNMMNPDILNTMPKDFQEGYFGLMKGIMDPNDPAFSEEEKPDPREPIKGKKLDWDPPTSPDDPNAWMINMEKDLQPVKPVFTKEELKRMQKEGVNPEWVQDFMRDKRGSMEDAINLAKKMIPRAPNEPNESKRCVKCERDIWKDEGSWFKEGIGLMCVACFNEETKTAGM